MIIKACNTVFTHVPKVAGQSMENAILAHLGKSRTANGPEFLLMKNEDPTKGPERLAHLTSSEYVANGYLSSEEFENGFSFGFVRDPWERTVSLYRYSGMASLINFRTFVLDYLPSLIKDRNWFYRPQADFLFDDQGKQVVSFIGRFESLAADWKYCCKQMGFPDLPLSKDNPTTPSGLLSPKSLKWLKIYPKMFTQLSISSKKHVNYKDYYDADTEKKVAALYERDCHLLNYSF